MKTSDIFGIRPTLSDYSYVDRKNLDTELAKLLGRQQTHIAVRGASKSGKSWLRQKVLSNPIIIQCRLSYDVVDIYKDALAELGISVEIEHKTGKTLTGHVTGVAEAGIPLLTKVSAELELEGETRTEITKKILGRDINDLKFVSTLIKASGRTLVIEDFHYLKTEEQKKFSYDLKTLWDYNTFVMIVGVWISENMLITLNPDLADRIEELSVTWQPEELKRVLTQGCGYLNLRLSDKVADELSEISYGSVGLLQKLTLRMIDDELGIEKGEEAGTELLLADDKFVHDAAMHVAEQLNMLYQAFAKRVSDGIRNRKNSTGIYAHAMAAIMSASDSDLVNGLSAKALHAVAHARQPRVQYGNLKTVLTRFPELQIDEGGRGLVIAYDTLDEKVSVVDKQLLLYRKFATIKWPWEEIIDEVGVKEDVYGDDVD
ncbi:hypothetical protein [Rhizobium sp. HT1-10]|uniref:hypothetical protein n=1 Tax=Rhizobium sp. HT1-10 TaxID=3111638 RepID=UPI003C1F90DC